jgi:hypothetical protein
MSPIRTMLNKDNIQNSIHAILHKVSVARLEYFRALKFFSLESFRALQSFGQNEGF